MAKKTKLASERSARKSVRKEAPNKSVRSEMKTMRSRVLTLIEDKDLEAEQGLKQAIAVMDRAASKGAIHQNRAARLKSRLTRRFNQAKAATS